jgi:hypothetical protein
MLSAFRDDLILEAGVLADPDLFLKPIDYFPVRARLKELVIIESLTGG